MSSPFCNKPKGPFVTVSFSNLNLTSDAVLQRIRSVFERNGFSVKQGEVRAGTAATIGGFSGGENGGLVGGMTTIDKKTWNPFLVNYPTCSLIQAEVTVLNVRQRIRAQNATCSAMEQDIELKIQIQMDEKMSLWITFAAGFVALFVGMFYAFDGGYDKDSRKLVAFLFAIVGGIIGMFAPGMLYWNKTNIQRLKNAVDKVIDVLYTELK